MHLVARLFTDAIFNQDVRSVATLIQRIDGGLPKDVDADQYKTEFALTLRELLNFEEAERLTLMPEDTVLMALCKVLYDIAVEDIYWDYEKNRPRKPTDTKKQLRDNAMRIILERAGGRKTLVVKPIEHEAVALAPWVQKALPG